MNLQSRIIKLEKRQKGEILSIEIISYEESEDPQQKLREREKELNRKIDVPIFIKVISGKDKMT